jgi:hypothetical protein
MEFYRNQVDDRSMRNGGTQCISTFDGYVLPLDIINGLAHLKSRPFSEREWQDLPHVVMTSDVEWDPSVLDNNISTEPKWYASMKPKTKDVITNPFDDIGECTKRQPEETLVYNRMDTKYPLQIPWEICLAQFRNLHREDMTTEEVAVRLSSDLIPYKELDDDSSHDNIILRMLLKRRWDVRHKIPERMSQDAWLRRLSDLLSQL